MPSVTETQPVLTRPRCCERGDLYLRRVAADVMHGPDETGWSLTLQGPYDTVRENVRFCPWCGAKMPEK